jgi:hypothetical protein
MLFCKGKIKEDRLMEAVLTPWLIKHDIDLPAGKEKVRSMI